MKPRPVRAMAARLSLQRSRCGWRRVAPRVATLPRRVGTGPVGPGCDRVRSPLGHNGDVAVNDDCRHYVMQTTARGDKLERCTVGANEPLPFTCPDGCVFYEPRRCQLGRLAGAPRRGRPRRAPADAPPPSALEHVAEQVHPDALLRSQRQRGLHCAGRPVELADDPTLGAPRRWPAGCSAPRRSAAPAGPAPACGTSDSGKREADPDVDHGDPVAPASTRLRLPERNPSRSRAT